MGYAKYHFFCSINISFSYLNKEREKKKKQKKVEKCSFLNKKFGLNSMLVGIEFVWIGTCGP